MKVLFQAPTLLQTNAQYSSQQSVPLTPTPFGSSGSIEIFGVSVAVSTYVQVVGGYSLQADAQGSLTGTATATGSVNGAMMYTPSSGLTPSGSAQPSGSMSYPTIQGSFGVDAMAYLTPQVSLQVEYIGSATASFTVYGEASLPDSCTLTQTVGSEVDVGAQVDVSIAGITVVQDNIASHAVSGPTKSWTGTEQVC